MRWMQCRRFSTGWSPSLCDFAACQTDTKPGEQASELYKYTPYISLQHTGHHLLPLCNRGPDLEGTNKTSGWSAGSMSALHSHFCCHGCSANHNIHTHYLPNEVNMSNLLANNSFFLAHPTVTQHYISFRDILVMNVSSVTLPFGSALVQMHVLYTVNPISAKMKFIIINK